MREITGKRGKALPHAVDKAGQIAFHLPAGLEFPWHFSAGIAPIIKDGKWGFIDRSGSIVVSPQYSAVLLYDVLWMMGSSM
ncbi:WG repeat-containing protein [Selenomonas sp.]|uniref:WG repeat-containing protein n=1 Tax=Selenomonas sp. TaxID=2053611 RepID=UPI00343EB29D